MVGKTGRNNNRSRNIFHPIESESDLGRCQLCLYLLQCWKSQELTRKWSETTIFFVLASVTKDSQFGVYICLEHLRIAFCILPSKGFARESHLNLFILCKCVFIISCIISCISSTFLKRVITDKRVGTSNDEGGAVLLKFYYYGLTTTTTKNAHKKIKRIFDFTSASLSRNSRN